MEKWFNALEFSIHHTWIFHPPHMNFPSTTWIFHPPLQLSTHHFNSPSTTSIFHPYIEKYWQYFEKYCNIFITIHCNIFIATYYWNILQSFWKILMVQEKILQSLILGDTNIGIFIVLPFILQYIFSKEIHRKYISIIFFPSLLICIQGSWLLSNASNSKLLAGDNITNNWFASNRSGNVHKTSSPSYGQST